VNRDRHLCFVAALGTMLLLGCSTPRGKPHQGSETLAPDAVQDFSALFADNCAGCHGAEGHGGAAIALADPVYLAIVDESAMRNVIAKGVPGTSMPAFAQSAGGMLTDKQVDVLTREIRSKWSRREVLGGANPPSYAAKLVGSAQHGQAVYGTYCASCHGPAGQGGTKASSITNGSFLALISDQGLRTVVITGRPELGAPDWRGNVPGKPMSDQDVTDVVAWLSSQRPKFPGQPYSPPSKAGQ